MDTAPCGGGWRLWPRSGDHRLGAREGLVHIERAPDSPQDQLSQCRPYVLIFTFRNEQSEKMERYFIQSQCGFWPGEHTGTEVPSSSAVLGGVSSTATTWSHTSDRRPLSQGATTGNRNFRAFCCAPGDLGGWPLRRGPRLCRRVGSGSGTGE